MRQLRSKTSLLAAVAVVLAISSCKNKDDMPTAEKNIDYPAAYVINGESSSISVIKLSTNTVTDSIELMGIGSNMIMWPHHVSYHAGTNMKHLAIGVPGMDFSGGHTGTTGGMTGNLLVVNAVNGSIVKSMALPLMNHNTAYSPSGTEIWVPQMDMDGKVLVYDAITYALKNTITVGMMPAELTFSADGTKAYVANGDDDNVSVINVSTKAVVATVNVGDNPVGAWTGSDGRMYVDNEDGQSISVINVTTDVVDQTIALGFMPGIAAHNGIKKELWVSDPMNGKVHYWTWDAGMNMWMHGGVFDTGAGAHAIAFTTDGNTAYVTNQLGQSVSVINVATHTKIKDIVVGKKPNGIVLKY